MGRAGGLRFPLASVVIVTHAYPFSTRPPWLLDLLQLGAFGAVLGFFLISGYSMAHSYGERPGGFFGRRVDRIYPLSLAAFLISMVPYAMFGTGLPVREVGLLEMPTPLQFFANAFCLQGLVAPHWGQIRLSGHLARKPSSAP